MREEVRSWWRQALEDLDAAKDNLGIGRYYVCAEIFDQKIAQTYLGDAQGIVEWARKRLSE